MVVGVRQCLVTSETQRYCVTTTRRVTSQAGHRARTEGAVINWTVMWFTARIRRPTPCLLQILVIHILTGRRLSPPDLVQSEGRNTWCPQRIKGRTELLSCLLRWRVKSWTDVFCIGNTFNFSKERIRVIWSAKWSTKNECVWDKMQTLTTPQCCHVSSYVHETVNRSPFATIALGHTR